MARKRTPLDPFKLGTSIVSKIHQPVFPSPAKTTNLRIMRSTRLQQKDPMNRFMRLGIVQMIYIRVMSTAMDSSELHQLDTFNNALNLKDQDSLELAQRETFGYKMPRECLKNIESKSKDISPSIALLRQEEPSLSSAPAPAPAPVKVIELKLRNMQNQVITCNPQKAKFDCMLSKFVTNLANTAVYFPPDLELFRSIGSLRKKPLIIKDAEVPTRRARSLGKRSDLQSPVTPSDQEKTTFYLLAHDGNDAYLRMPYGFNAHAPGTFHQHVYLIMNKEHSAYGPSALSISLQNRMPRAILAPMGSPLQ
ncbi:hypothetical protein Tco_0828251 [Tanacetum coccineum]